MCIFLTTLVFPCYHSIIRDWCNRSIGSCHILPDWYNWMFLQLNTPNFQTFDTFICSTLHYIFSYSVTIHGTPEHSTEESACRESSSSCLSGISQHKTFVKKNNTECTNVSCFTSLCPARYYLPSPPAAILSSVYVLKSQYSLPMGTV